MGMSMRGWPLAALIAAGSLALSSGAAAFDSTLKLVPHRPMPEKAYRLLRKAVESYRPPRDYERRKRADSLKLLEDWRKAPWPVLKGLQRVHIDLFESRGEIFSDRINAWRVSGTFFLLDDFTIRHIGADKATPHGYGEELRELTDYAAARVKAETHEDHQALKKRRLRLVRGMQLKDSPLYPGVVPIHHAYIAALAGNEEAVKHLVAAAMEPHGELRDAYDWAARQRAQAAMWAFHNGSRREELLAALEEAHEMYPASKCAAEMASIIGPVKRELAAGPPAYVRKRPGERTREEEIRALVYELREIAGGQMSVPGYPDVFQHGRLERPRMNPAVRLMEIGPEAIPHLIEALDDYTPTRTVGHRWIARLLRRMDVAMHTIEAIAGCEFYHEASTSGDLHNDTPERRQAAVKLVKRWWRMSEGASQAEMIRNRLRLLGRRDPGSVHERMSAIWRLSLVDGSASVLDEVARLPAKYADKRGERTGSPRGDVMLRIDRRLKIRDRIERYHQKRLEHGQFSDVLTYGDRRTYAELTKRFEATGILDPVSGLKYRNYDLEEVGRRGGAWALPILAIGLTKTESRRSRPEGDKTRHYTDADVAAEHFQRLAGRDFGYRKDDDEEDRRASIEKARRWWLAEGRRALAAKIAGPPPGQSRGDLYMSDEKIDAVAAALAGDDAAARREAVAELGRAFGRKVQRALLVALKRETDARERIAILRALKAAPRPWHLPAATAILVGDGPAELRAEAARLMGAVGLSSWSTRHLAPTVAARRAARRVAADEGAPVEVRAAAAEALCDGICASPRDVAIVTKLGADPAFKGFEKLQYRAKHWARLFSPTRAAGE